MKIIRTSKCYFNKWLTKKKLRELDEILKEYARICNYFVENYENDIPQLSKYDLDKTANIHKCIEDTKTFLSVRLVRQAFHEAYGNVRSAKSNVKNKNGYYRPIFDGHSMLLSENSCIHEISQHICLFDYFAKLRCLRKDKGIGYSINIPLKRHKQFNKWMNLGQICKSVVVTNKYILFSFEIETGPKKEVGSLVGFDFGMKRLGTVSNGNVIGTDIFSHLQELHQKKKCSKGYYRKKEEIKEYINREIKNIDFSDKKLVVVEALKNMKYKMKERGRLSKNIRSFFYDLSYSQVLNRVEMLCEENRVTFRSVSPYYTSQECSHCGHIEKANRKSQESFICQKCGYSDNADLNASKVILKRFVMGTYGSHYQQEYLNS